MSVFQDHQSQSGCRFVPILNVLLAAIFFSAQCLVLFGFVGENNGKKVAAAKLRGRGWELLRNRTLRPEGWSGSRLGGGFPGNDEAEFRGR